MADKYADPSDPQMAEMSMGPPPGAMEQDEPSDNNFEEGFDQDEDFGEDFRGNRNRGGFRRGRGGPWGGGGGPGGGGPPGGGPPGGSMRFRGRGYGLGGPPPRGRGQFQFRGRGNGDRGPPQQGPPHQGRFGPPGHGPPGHGPPGHGPPGHGPPGHGPPGHGPPGHGPPGHGPPGHGPPGHGPPGHGPPGHGPPGHGPPGQGAQGPPSQIPPFDPQQHPWGPMGPPPGVMGPGGPPFGPPPGMMGPLGPLGPPPHLGPFGPGGPGGVPGGPGGPGPQPDLWVETKTEDGKSYFYHARTRDTTWTRPQEGPQCKVITQAEVEQMAQNQTAMVNANPIGNQQMGGPNNPMLGPNGPMGGAMGPGGAMPMNGPPPMGIMGPNGPIMNMMGPPFGGKNGSAMDDDDDDSQEHINDSGSTGTGRDGPDQPKPMLNFSGPPPGMGLLGLNSSLIQKTDGEDVKVPNDGRPPAMGAPFLGPPPGAGGPMRWPGPGVGGVGGVGPGGPGPGWPWPGAPPLWTAPGALPLRPPTALAAPAAVAPLAVPAVAPAAVPNPAPAPAPAPALQKEPAPAGAAVPAELALRAAEWSGHRAPDGRPYYYHAQRRESVWEKPQPLKDLEAFQKNAAAAMGAGAPVGSQPTLEAVEAQATPQTAESAAGAGASPAAVAEEPAAEPAGAQALVAEREAERERRRAEERRRQEEAERERQAALAKQQQDKSRPVSSTPISGTPWCVVWTGDGRVFFYNPTAHSSVWERPEQLVGRADVDRAVANPPDALAGTQKKESTTATAAVGTTTNGVKRDADDSSDDGTPNKKPRQEVPATSTVSTASTTTTTTTPTISTTTTQIDLGKEAAIEAEVRAARERAMIPLEVRIKSFREMLAEKKVSAFSTWEKELHKIVFDSRYLVLTSKERKQVFEKYVRERAEEERKEKRNRLVQKKDDFRTLLEEAKLHGKSSFADFSSKYGKEERFKALDKMRERESIFNEFIVEVRKREKEERTLKKEQKLRGGDVSEEELIVCNGRMATPPPDQWLAILGIPETEQYAQMLAHAQLRVGRLDKAKRRHRAAITYHIDNR